MSIRFATRLTFSAKGSGWPSGNAGWPVTAAALGWRSRRSSIVATYSSEPKRQSQWQVSAYGVSARRKALFTAPA
jgi:hypothetical protein